MMLISFQPISYGGGALAPTKIKSGRQRIKVGKVAVALLKEHRQRQEMQKAFACESWQEHGMIFTTSVGTFIDQTKISREFKYILRENNLPDIRFHDLCHTSLSILLNLGTPPQHGAAKGGALEGERHHRFLWACHGPFAGCGC
jgi:hypothetical protein